jgi:hypothetical protein
MPDPPPFVNYSSADGAPLTSSASKITSRPAQFTRSSQRVNRPSATQPQPDDEPLVNTAGVGSANRASNPNDTMLPRGTTLSRSSTRRHAPTTNGSNNLNGPINGISPSSSPTANTRHPTGIAPPTSTIQHEPVSENPYRVDPSKDQRAATNVGDDSDPMVQAMANLRTAAGTTIGRSGTRRVTAPDVSGLSGISPIPPAKALTSPAPVSPGRNPDYRKSAEFVVGVPPVQAPPSRSTSPVPPTANFMQPPPSQAPAHVVDAVLDSYHQSFPGERRSRSNSRRASFNAPQPAAAPPPHGQTQVGNHLERPVGGDVHAGVGANGRSRSPSINHPASRSTSPAPPGPAHGGSLNRPDQGAAQGQYRATTPNSVGIALDPHGNVAMDAMADMYRQQQQQPVVQPRQLQQAQAPPPMQPPPPAPAQYPQPPVQPQQIQAPGSATPRSPQRQAGMGNPYIPPATWQTSAPVPPPQQQYIPPPPAQQQPPRHSPSYVQAPHPYANAPPSQIYHGPQMGYGAPSPPQPQQQQLQQQPRQQQTAQHGGTGSNHADYFAPPHQAYTQPPQQPQPQPQQRQYQQHHHQQVTYGGGGGYNNRSLSPGPVNRSPSPQPMALTQPQPQPILEPPTHQYTEDGRGVLFYGAFLIPFFFS